MDFLADLAMVIFTVYYFKLNKRLYKWRLAVAEKYPRGPYEGKSFKADMRGMWELMVSIFLICGLFMGWMFVCYLPVRVGHESAQIVLVPVFFYWCYTFVSVATYPESHQLFRWFGKQGRKLLNRPSV